MPAEGIHKRLDNYDEIARAVRDINDRINGRGFNFREDSACLHKSFARGHVSDADKALVILSSFDFSYYHDLEIIFYNVIYSDIGEEYNWWDHWAKDQLELQNEVASDAKGDAIFEFRFNRGTHRDDQFIVRAKQFSYHFGHVPYRDS